MRNDLAQEQEGYCGNFDSDPVTYDKDLEDPTSDFMKTLKVEDNEGKGPFQYVDNADGRRLGAGPPRRLEDLDQELVDEKWQVCKAAHVAKGLRMGCAEDIVTLGDDEQESVIEEYQLYSGLWKVVR